MANGARATPAPQPVTQARAAPPPAAQTRAAPAAPQATPPVPSPPQDTFGGGVVGTPQTPGAPIPVEQPGQAQPQQGGGGFDLANLAKVLGLGGIALSGGIAPLALLVGAVGHEAGKANRNAQAKAEKERNTAIHNAQVEDFGGGQKIGPQFGGGKGETGNPFIDPLLGLAKGLGIGGGGQPAPQAPQGPQQAQGPQQGFRGAPGQVQAPQQALPQPVQRQAPAAQPPQARPQAGPQQPPGATGGLPQPAPGVTFRRSAKSPLTGETFGVERGPDTALAKAAEQRRQEQATLRTLGTMLGADAFVDPRVKRVAQAAFDSKDAGAAQEAIDAAQKGFPTRQLTGAISTPATLTELQKNLKDIRLSRERFKVIRDKFDPRALTLPGKAAAFVGNTIEYLTGVAISKEFRTGFSQMVTAAQLNFNLYVKFITGAQFSIAEADRYLVSYPNPEKDNPTQFVAKFIVVDEMAAAEEALITDMLRFGVDPNSPQGLEARQQALRVGGTKLGIIEQLSAEELIGGGFIPEAPEGAAPLTAADIDALSDEDAIRSAREQGLIE